MPSAVVCRSGGVITPALPIRMSIGSPRARRRSPSAATDSSDDRSSASVDTDASGAAARIVASAASPFAALRTGSSTSAPACASRVAMPSPMRWRR